MEALSRGASRVVFVDASAGAVAAIRENVALLKDVGEAQVYRQDARLALAALADSGVRFDIVYIDPPYESDLYELVLAQCGEMGLLVKDGLVVAEHFHKRRLPETIGGLLRAREVRVGDHCLSFYRLEDKAR